MNTFSKSSLQIRQIKALGNWAGKNNWKCTTYLRDKLVHKIDFKNKKIHINFNLWRSNRLTNMILEDKFTYSICCFYKNFHGYCSHEFSFMVHRISEFMHRLASNFLHFTTTAVCLLLKFCSIALIICVTLFELFTAQTIMI